MFESQEDIRKDDANLLAVQKDRRVNVSSLVTNVSPCMENESPLGRLATLLLSCATETRNLFYTVLAYKALSRVILLDLGSI